MGRIVNTRLDPHWTSVLAALVADEDAGLVNTDAGCIYCGVHDVALAANADHEPIPLHRDDCPIMRGRVILKQAGYR